MNIFTKSMWCQSKCFPEGYKISGKNVASAFQRAYGFAALSRSVPRLGASNWSLWNDIEVANYRMGNSSSSGSITSKFFGCSE